MARLQAGATGHRERAGIVAPSGRGDHRVDPAAAAPHQEQPDPLGRIGQGDRASRRQPGALIDIEPGAIEVSELPPLPPGTVVEGIDIVVRVRRAR